MKLNFGKLQSSILELLILSRVTTLPHLIPCPYLWHHNISWSSGPFVSPRPAAKLQAHIQPLFVHAVPTQKVWFEQWEQPWPRANPSAWPGPRPLVGKTPGMNFKLIFHWVFVQCQVCLSWWGLGALGISLWLHQWALAAPAAPRDLCLLKEGGKGPWMLLHLGMQFENPSCVSSWVCSLWGREDPRNRPWQSPSICWRPVRKLGKNVLAGCGRRRGNGFKLKEGLYKLDIRREFHTMRVVKHWVRLPTDVGDVPPLEILNTRLDGALSSLT